MAHDGSTSACWTNAAAVPRRAEVTSCSSSPAACALWTPPLNSPVRYLPVSWLLASCEASLEVVGQEMSAVVATMIASDEPETRLGALRFAGWLMRKLITIGQALAMDSALTRLMQHQPMGIWDARWASDLISQFQYLVNEPFSSANGTAQTQMAAVGRYLINHPRLPWIAGGVSPMSQRLDRSLRSVKNEGGPAFTPATAQRTMITKGLCAYRMNYLRRRTSLRDHERIDLRSAAHVRPATASNLPNKELHITAPSATRCR